MCMNQPNLCLILASFSAYPLSYSSLTITYEDHLLPSESYVLIFPIVCVLSESPIFLTPLTQGLRSSYCE